MWNRMVLANFLATCYIMKVKFLSIVFFLLGCLACVERFIPAEIMQAPNYLVVDGFFNAGYDTSTVILSRTQALQETTLNPEMERGATVTVEGRKGRVLTFKETDNGIYMLSPELVDQQDQYRIRIKTKGGQIYLSDYYTTIISPAIDSITYVVEGKSEGVTLKVSTHDGPGRARFYRWYYDETWEYVSVLNSPFVVVNRGTPAATIEERTDNIYQCWKSDKSKKIMIASTAKQSENLLREHDFAYVPTSSGKFVVKYSLLLRQHAISREAFEYWTSLDKTTESTGSIFDPLPTLVTGNIKNVENSTEPVFGFFTASIPSEKRFFLPERFGMSSMCGDTVVSEQTALQLVDSLIVGEVVDPIYSTRYRVAHISCVDCRFYRGTNIKPSFWK